MNQSQQVLLCLLKKSLFDINFTLPKNIDWNEVYEEAKFQSVIPFAFDATNEINSIPGDVYKKLKSSTISIMLNNDRILNGQNKLVDLLENNNVDYAILKGASIAKDYRKPDLRTLGDVDFLVRKSEFQNVKQLLIDNNYSLVEDEHNHFHCVLKKNEVFFEMHFEVTDFPQTVVGNELKADLDMALDNVVDMSFSYLKFKGLNKLYQAVSLLLHTERHLSKDGIGLRQMLDWCFFIYANPDFLEKEGNINYLKKYGLYKLALVCKDLSDKYFLDKDIDNPVADMLFELVLKKGNFGKKRDLEETYINGLDFNKHRNSFSSYFIYCENRAEITWDLAKRIPFLKHIAFIYLPIRHFFRVLFKHGRKFDYGKIKESSNEVIDIYSELKVFER